MSDPGRIPTTTRRDVGGIGWYIAAPIVGIVLVMALVLFHV